MTDLAERAVARLTEIDDAIQALEHERGEISTALRVLATLLESRPAVARDGDEQTAPETGVQAAAVTLAAVESVAAEEAQDSSAPIPGNGAGSAETEASVANVGATASANSSQAVDVAASAVPFPSHSSPAPSAGTGSEEDRQPIQGPVAFHPADPPRSGAAEGNEADLPAPDAIPSGRPSNRARVTALFAEHPEYTRKQAREVLGLSEGSLDGTSHVLGIKWAPEPKPELPRAESPRPVNDDEIVTRQSPRPNGKMFWLRNASGEYLHRYCDRLTRNRKEAWTGTEAQILGCRKNFSIARDLIERPVEKDGAFV